MESLKVNSSSRHGCLPEQVKFRFFSLQSKLTLQDIQWKIAGPHFIYLFGRVKLYVTSLKYQNSSSASVQ